MKHRSHCIYAPYLDLFYALIVLPVEVVRSITLQSRLINIDIPLPVAAGRNDLHHQGSHIVCGQRI